MKYIYVIEFMDGSVRKVETDTPQDIIRMLHQSLIAIKGNSGSTGIYCASGHVRCICEAIKEK